MEDMSSECVDDKLDELNPEPCLLCSQLPFHWENIEDIIFDECMELKVSYLDNNKVRYHSCCQ
jgi:hypothetical protein